MKLQVGTEFNIVDGNNRTNYRKVIFENGQYKTINEEGNVIFHSSMFSLEELNNYYLNHKSWVIEIISQPQSTQEDELEVDLFTTDEIGRVIAYELMKRGKSLSPEMLGIIEDAVFDFLIEKEYGIEVKDE